MNFSDMLSSWLVTGHSLDSSHMLRPCRATSVMIVWIDDSHSDDGAELVFSWRMSGNRQVIDGVHDDCVRIV